MLNTGKLGRLVTVFAILGSESRQCSNRFFTSTPALAAAAAAAPSKTVHGIPSVTSSTPSDSILQINKFSLQIIGSSADPTITTVEDTNVCLASHAKCKTIHFMRHAEAKHNVDEKAYPEYHTEKWYLRDEYLDTKLTENGIKQCEMLRDTQHFQNLKSCNNFPGLIVVSPLSRAIQSASIAFQDSIVPTGTQQLIVSELCRERIADYMTDKRRSLSDLQNEFGEVASFTTLKSEQDELWHSKETEPTEYASEQCFKRALNLLEWLHSRNEDHIVVVSHWVFLRHLFGMFANQDVRFGDLVLGNADLLTTELCVQSNDN